MVTEVDFTHYECPGNNGQDFDFRLPAGEQICPKCGQKIETVTDIERELIQDDIGGEGNTVNPEKRG